MSTYTDRFWSKVFKSPKPGCWLWTSPKLDDGYAMFYDGQKMVLAHRYSWALAGHPLPDYENGRGSMLDHICRVRHCVNPAHMRVVTRKQNNEHLDADGSLRKNNSSGFRGVSKAGDSWTAQVMHRGRNHCKRGFDTPEAAGEWARAKRLELFTHSDGDSV